MVMLKTSPRPWPPGGPDGRGAGEGCGGGWGWGRGQGRGQGRPGSTLAARALGLPGSAAASRPGLVCRGTRAVDLGLAQELEEHGLLDAPVLAAAAPLAATAEARRGAWARVTIDQFRHPALHTFKTYRASSNVLSNKMTGRALARCARGRRPRRGRGTAAALAAGR
jgi:hypothetical protein